MYDGFIPKRIATSGAEIALVQGGSGPPLLLVHGYPQTHVMWHKVAPRLAQQFTVVAPDLRGYGASSKPPTDDEHIPYSKRAMALGRACARESAPAPQYSRAAWRARRRP